MNGTPTGYRFMAAMLAGLVSTVSATTPGTAATVKLGVQAPFNIETGAFHLSQVSNANPVPFFQSTFQIPYPWLEKEVRQLLQRQLDARLGNTLVCPGPCLDLTWQASLISDFAFTHEGKPTLQEVGKPGENLVSVELDAQARIAVNASVKASVDPFLLGRQGVEVSVPMEALVGLHGSATLQLYPVLRLEKLTVDLTRDGLVVDNGDVQDVITGLAAFTGGMLAGPLGSLVGVLVSGEIADEATAQMSAAIAQAFDEQVVAAENRLAAEITGALDPALAQANAYRDQLLKTVLPGINRSLIELQKALGFTLDVRSHVPDPEHLTLAVTTRFSHAAGGGDFAGVLRLPKAACEYSVVGYQDYQVSLPTAVVTINADLQKEVGRRCVDVFAPSDLRLAVYRGESPDTVLMSGLAVNALPVWSKAGAITFPGQLADKGSYFQCDYQASALPGSAIVEVTVSPALDDRLDTSHGLKESPYRRRVMVVGFGGAEALFDEELHPVPPPGLVVGGQGPQGSNPVFACPIWVNGEIVDTSAELNPLPDPERCPQCGLRVLDRKQRIYEVINLGAFQTTRIGLQVKALVDGVRARAGLPSSVGPTP